jgi:MoxR-like ATPase
VASDIPEREAARVVTATACRSSREAQASFRKTPAESQRRRQATRRWQPEVALSNKTRPGTSGASPIAGEYLGWGAGPRASQYLVLGAKCNALLNGKYSPDIEDVQAIAKPVMRHRIVRNFKAEAEGISVDQIIEKLMV